MVTKDAHPFLAPRVRKYLEQKLHLDESSRMKWLRHWINAGSCAIEDVLAHDHAPDASATAIDYLPRGTSHKCQDACDPPSTAGGTSDGATLREYKTWPSALP
jgi:hypothetical protein